MVISSSPLNSWVRETKNISMLIFLDLTKKNIFLRTALHKTIRSTQVACQMNYEPPVAFKEKQFLKKHQKISNKDNKGELKPI